MSDTPTRHDRTRQVVVTLAGLFCVYGTLVGTGVLGTSVSSSAGGALSDEATHLAPAGPAFSIWSVVYAGLAAYVVWQWLPGRASDPRLRATGWLAAVSMVLNAGWLLVTQTGWIWVSVVVILALVLDLGLLVVRLGDRPARDVAERVVVDGTFGLYLGWVMLATVANTAAALAASDVRPGTTVADVGAVLVLAVVALLVWLVNARVGGRWTVALAAAWGLGWIAYGRTAESPESVPAAVAAGLAALVVLVGAARQSAVTGRPAT